jgi:intracellular multiplication protein IcmO
MRKFSFIETTRDLRLGGHKDAIALTALAGSILLLCPFLDFGHPALEKGVAAVLMFGSVLWIAHRYAQCWQYAPYLSTGMEKIKPSGQLPTRVDKEGKPEKDGLLLGYTVDSGKGVYLPYEDLMRHAIVVGQSGVGKTVAGSLLFMQQIERGGGAVLIDGKLNEGDLLKVYRMASYFGRESDVLVINPGDPSLSNTYNPILHGDADEVAARILSLIPSTSNDAATDYYKQAANQGIVVIVAAIKRLKLAYNFMDLSILLMNPRALEELESRLPECDEKVNLTLFLDQFRDHKGYIDAKKIKEIFGGIGGRLFTFGSGNFGDITSSYNPDVKLTEALLQKKIIYVMLPTMGKDIAAGNFGQMMVSDLRSSIAELQKLPDEEKPWPPTLAFMDEAGEKLSWLSPSATPWHESHEHDYQWGILKGENGILPLEPEREFTSSEGSFTVFN